MNIAIVPVEGLAARLPPLETGSVGGGEKKKIVLPGEVIETPEGFMRGHGTHEAGGKMRASVCGVVEKVNKLIYVRPLRSRYHGETGDVVVGRIDEVGQGKWLVDVGSTQRGQLHLAAVNLPKNEQRRRTAADELVMRKFFAEGELASTEVQRVLQDGVILLHTRSAKYGKLQNGCFIKVPPTLVRRQQQHMFTLPNGVYLVLGNNGYIWVSVPPKESHLDTLNSSLTEVVYETVPVEKRLEIALARECIAVLAAHFTEITAEAIFGLIKLCRRDNLQAKDLMQSEIGGRLCEEYARGETNA